MLCVLKEQKILAVFLDHQNTGIPYTSNTVAMFAISCLPQLFRHLKVFPKSLLLCIVSFLFIFLKHFL